LSGHSKWANIKHKKARMDAKRGKIFSKITREIIMAARAGGGNPEHNIQLKLAIQKARDNNIPNDNIKRAIDRGTGAAGGDDYEAFTYEGYGPAGVALLLDIATDNRNRTAGEIRYIFSKNGGNLGEAGCVAWMFDRRGYITVPAEGVDEDELLMAALDSGAEDMQREEDVFEVFTGPDDVQAVREALEAAGFQVGSAEVSMVPQNTVEVTGKDARQVLRLVESLEDHDDVQNVYANFDIPDDELEALSG